MNVSKKILLVQLCANGDCLYATTVARQIKNDYPGCHLTWAIAGFCKAVIAGNPYVDEVLEVNDVPKNNLAAFRRFKKKILREKRNGAWDEVFITQVIDNNVANYDGCIRSATFRGYSNKITVPVTPVLRLSEVEKDRVHAFAEKHQLSNYKNVILFEFAPLSGQASITRDNAVKIAETLASNTNAAVILSSGDRLRHPDERIIDGSILTIRETAGLTHHCNFLMGCSSGITWISTSDAAKPLPMVQLLSPNSIYLNSVVRDFQRQGLLDSRVIEITNFTVENVVSCVDLALTDFDQSKKIYHTEIPLSFLTSRYVVCNLVLHFQFAAVLKHIKINRSLYGNRFAFYKECLKGVWMAPLTAIKIIWQRLAAIRNS